MYNINHTLEQDWESGREENAENREAAVPTSSVKPDPKN